MAKPVNKKLWIILSIVAVLLIGTAVAGLFLLVLPEYNKGQVIKGLEKSDKEMAVDAYDKLSDSAKDDLQDDLDDFAAYRINQYFDGGASFDEVNSQLDIIADNMDVSDDYSNIVDQFYFYAIQEITWDYVKDASKIELRSSSEQVDEIYAKVSDYGALADSFDAFYDGVFDEYIVGNLDYKEITKFHMAAESFGKKFGASKPLNNRTEFLTLTDIDYNREVASVYMKNGLYMDALEVCLKDYIGYTGDDSDSVNVKKKKLEAAEDANICKKELINNIDSALSRGDDKKAKEIFDELVIIFGEGDPELAELSSSFVPKWKAVYKDFVTGDYMARLAEDCATGYVAENKYDSTLVAVSDYPIERVALWDLDDNDVPELILYGSDNMTYFYTCENNELTFCGAFRIISSVNENEFIATPNVDLGDGVKEVDVLFYSGGAWGISMSFINDNGNYSVDGTQMDEAEFTETLNEVEQNLTINTDSAYFSVADNYIENWTK